MSLFEWIGESFSPGARGTVESGAAGPGHWNPRVIVIRGVIAAGLVSGLFVWLIASALSPQAMVAALLGAAGYCVLAYWVSPEPDFTNVGLLGGLIDHPFRWSDDYNRWLVFFALLLWPGRFVSVSVRDLLRLAQGKRVIALPSRDE